MPLHDHYKEHMFRKDVLNFQGRMQVLVADCRVANGLMQCDAAIAWNLCSS